MTTLLQCPNCFAPLPPPGSGHATCRFCGFTSIVKGGQPGRPAKPNQKQQGPSANADPVGAKALALDFQAQHGFDIAGNAQAMERLGAAWAKASAEVAEEGRATVNAPFLAVAGGVPVHYSRELDSKTIASLYAVAKKLG